MSMLLFPVHPTLSFPPCIHKLNILKKFPKSHLCKLSKPCNRLKKNHYFTSPLHYITKDVFLCVFVCVYMYVCLYLSVCICVWGLARWLRGKDSTCNSGDANAIPESGRRRKWQPTPIFLPRKSCGQRSLTGYSRKESGMT